MIYKGAVHKRRHQSGGGAYEKMILLNNKAYLVK